MKNLRLPILIASSWVLTGCAGGASSGWDMQRWNKRRGEPWTIQCVEVTGVDRKARSEALGHELRATRGLQPKLVRIVHGNTSSKVLYGTYYRPIDPESGRLLRPDALNRDIQLIQQGRFIGARAVSAPETDVGNPSFNLKNAKGTYTLLIAVFENTADFYDRKKAAADYANELRGKGYEAYYRHGPRASEVTLGTFGPDAIIEQEQTSVQYERSNTITPYVSAKTRITNYSAPVKQLQSRETFRYQLVNLKRVSITIHGRRQYLASQLVRIHPGTVEW